MQEEKTKLNHFKDKFITVNPIGQDNPNMEQLGLFDIPRDLDDE